MQPGSSQMKSRHTTYPCDSSKAQNQNATAKLQSQRLWPHLPKAEDHNTAVKFFSFEWQQTILLTDTILPLPLQVWDKRVPSAKRSTSCHKTNHASVCWGKGPPESSTLCPKYFCLCDQHWMRHMSGASGRHSFAGQRISGHNSVLSRFLLCSSPHPSNSKEHSKVSTTGRQS